jgi:hypothetical protein
MKGMPRQNTEVPHLDGVPREQPVESPIKMVKDGEHNALGSPLSARKHDHLATALFEGLDEPRHILRSIFPVPIHDNNGSTR